MDIKHKSTKELKIAFIRMYNELFYQFLLREKIIDHSYDIDIVFYHFFAKTVFDGDPYWYYFTGEETKEQKEDLMNQYLSEYVQKEHFPNEHKDYIEYFPPRGVKPRHVRS